MMTAHISFCNLNSFMCDTTTLKWFAPWGWLIRSCVSPNYLPPIIFDSLSQWQIIVSSYRSYTLLSIRVHSLLYSLWWLRFSRYRVKNVYHAAPKKSREAAATWNAVIHHELIGLLSISPYIPVSLSVTATSRREKFFPLRDVQMRFFVKTFKAIFHELVIDSKLFISIFSFISATCYLF